MTLKNAKVVTSESMKQDKKITANQDCACEVYQDCACASVC